MTKEKYKKAISVIQRLRIRKLAVIFVLIAIVMAGCGEESSSDRSTEPESNIKEISFLKADDVKLDIGKTTSESYITISVKKKKDFSPEDVVFISDDPNVAVIKYSHALSFKKTILYYNITAIGGGSTEVYVKSVEGDVESEHIKVTVPTPIVVTSIKIAGAEDKSDLILGDYLELEATALPSAAKDRAIKWYSSDESVMTVNYRGDVRAVGGGSATITASTSNGVSNSIDFNVDGTKRKMYVRVARGREDDVDIGREWDYYDEVNGEPIGEIIVSVGDVLKLYSEYTEYDDYPDVGEASTKYKVTQDDVTNGFEVEMNLFVKENGGRNSGQKAHFNITYNFRLE